MSDPLSFIMLLVWLCMAIPAFALGWMFHDVWESWMRRLMERLLRSTK